MKAQLKSCVKCPRWARVDKAIEEVAEALGLDCEVNRTTFLLWETVHFTVEGDLLRVRAFKASFIEAAHRWNGEDDSKGVA